MEQYETGFNEFKLSFIQACIHTCQGTFDNALSSAVTASKHTANKHEDEMSTVLLNIIHILTNNHDSVATDSLHSSSVSDIKTIFEFYQRQKACDFHKAPHECKDVHEWIDEVIHQTQFYHRYHIDNLIKHIVNSSSNKCLNIVDKYDFVSSNQDLNDHHNLLSYSIKIKHILENPQSSHKNDVINNFTLIEPVLIKQMATMSDSWLNHLRKMTHIISLKFREDDYTPLFTIMLDLHHKIATKKDHISLTNQIVSEHMDVYDSIPNEFNIFMMSTLKTQPILRKSYFKAFRKLFQSKTTLLLPEQFMKYYPAITFISSEHNNLYQVIEQSWLENLFESIKIGMPGEVLRLRQTLNYMINASFFTRSSTSQQQFNNKILQLISTRFQLSTLAPICEYLIQENDLKIQVGKLINTELVTCCHEKQSTTIHDALVFLKKHDMHINDISISLIKKHVESMIHHHLKTGDIQNASKLVDCFSKHDEICNTITFQNLAFNTLFISKNTMTSLNYMNSLHTQRNLTMKKRLSPTLSPTSTNTPKIISTRKSITTTYQMHSFITSPTITGVCPITIVLSTG